MAENNKILRKLSEISKTFNNYFVNIIDKLCIYNWVEDAMNYSKLTERINNFNNHPSIQWIMYKYKKSFNLKIEFVSTNQVPKYINEIDCNKNSSGDIPAKLIKIAKDEVIAPITNCVDKCIF